MKLLVDENLAPRLAGDLGDLFPGSVHVSAVDMGGTADAVIWKFARAHAFTFLTKDKDFGSLGMVWGAPPKVILLQTGNCPTASIERIIRRNAIRLSDFEADPKRGLLVLR